MKLDMNAVWSRGMVLVRENFQLLAVIAGVFFLLPAMLINFIMPADETTVQVMNVLLDPNASQTAKDTAMAKASEIFGPVMGWTFALNIASFVGYGAMMALMGSSRPTVGEALVTGLKSVISVVGAFVIFMVLYFVVAVVLVVPIAMVAGAIGAPVLAVFAPFLVIVAAFYLMARMSLTLPVIVNEHALNPLKALKRSWDLTRPSAWGVLGFWGILTVAYLVILLLVGGVFAMIASLAGQGTVATLIVGLANGLLAVGAGMVMSGLAVAMHGQLAGPSEQDISSTFD